MKQTPYIISIDRQSKTWAVFEDIFKVVKAFEPYQDEQIALAAARAWVKERSTVEPEVVYPRLKKVHMSS